MAWTSEYRTFADETFYFFKSGDSVIVTQRDFRAHFMLLQNDAVRIENRYYYGRKISETLVDRLKKTPYRIKGCYQPRFYGNSV